MDRKNADLMLLDSGPIAADDKVTFFGIDWGRKDRSGCVCPRCQEPHSWRKRIPHRCRHCGLKFNFTASEI